MKNLSLTQHDIAATLKSNNAMANKSFAQKCFDSIFGKTASQRDFEIAYNYNLKTK